MLKVKADLAANVLSLVQGSQVAVTGVVKRNVCALAFFVKLKKIELAFRSSLKLVA